MKPHFFTDLSSFTSTATRKQLNGLPTPGVLQYNQFNITVNATNEFTNPHLNKGLINIRMEYEAQITSSQVYVSMLYFCIVILLIAGFLSLMYLNFRM
jgi:hypothetical protein